MQLTVLGESFEGSDPAFHSGHRNDAGPGGHAVHDHRARAALSEPAAESRTLQAKIIAQDIEKRSRRIDVQGVDLPLTIKVRLIGDSPCESSGRRATGFDFIKPQDLAIGHAAMLRAAKSLFADGLSQHAGMCQYCMLE